ncbi:MAG: isochorismatase family protein [Candidatus Hydrogenedentes bacterium]|nr:isochorismatase family protein [Candidatus Hydrogenedentota bacterium]
MLLQDQAILIVLDIQDIFMPKSDKVVEKYLRQATRIIKAAQTLKIPTLVTEQYPERFGATNTGIKELLGDTIRMPKIEFGCLANDTFKAVLAETGRKQILITGMEAHICILQTTLDALDDGYEVYLLQDAIVSSRKEEYKAGMARMQQAGAICVTVEMAIFELLRQAGTPEFKKLLPLIKA